MVAKDFPCKLCTHGAGRHYLSVGGLDPICLDCATSKGSISPDEHWHAFVGDNLAYVELQKRKQEILDEQA